MTWKPHTFQVSSNMTFINEEAEAYAVESSSWHIQLRAKHRVVNFQPLTASFSGREDLMRDFSVLLLSGLSMLCRWPTLKPDIFQNSTVILFVLSYPRFSMPSKNNITIPHTYIQYTQVYVPYPGNNIEKYISKNFL